VGKNSAIEWTTHTWNPWYGCTKVSDGCKFCYAERQMARFGKEFKGPKMAASSGFEAPLCWPKIPGRVFVCSWSDFFHEDVPLVWQSRAMNIMTALPHFTFQILTKRPARISPVLNAIMDDPLPSNIWLGVSVERNGFVCRLKQLTENWAAVHFISAEPLLGSLTDGLARLDLTDIEWIITGGESGRSPRLTDPVWFREVRDLCRQENIPYFHKQNGGSKKIDGAWGGRLLDGAIHDAMPPGLGPVDKLANLP